MRDDSLKKLLEDEGRVAPEEAARIAKEAAEALHYAHVHAVNGRKFARPEHRLVLFGSINFCPRDAIRRGCGRRWKLPNKIVSNGSRRK